MASAGCLSDCPDTVSVASDLHETASLPWAVAVSDGVRKLDVFSCGLAVLYLLVCVCGLAGNTLVAVAVVKMDRLSSSTSVYMLTLALADGLFMLGLPLIAAQNLLHRWPFGDAACRLLMVLDGTNQFTSAFCLTAMSVDRYLALSDPLRFAGWRRPRRAALVSLLLWLLSMVPVLPVAAHFSARGGFCAVDPELTEGGGGLAFLCWAFALGFALPLCIMLATYGALAWRRRHGGGPGAAVTVTETERAERRVTVMVAAVAAVFGACWLPFYVLNFLALWLGEWEEQAEWAEQAEEVFVHGFEAAVLLSYAWSCANPLLYACLSHAFRRHFSALLCPRKNTPTNPRQPDTEHYDLNDSALHGPEAGVRV